jgi:hypothetical protein
VKKALATILAFLYLATSTDAMVTIHYCMGKVYSVDLAAKEKCSKCGMKNSKGCCKDEVKRIKIQDKQQLSGTVIQTPPALSGTPLLQAPVFDHNVSILFSQPAVHNNSPPGLSTTPLTILYGVFRI